MENRMHSGIPELTITEASQEEQVKAEPNVQLLQHIDELQALLKTGRALRDCRFQHSSSRQEDRLKFLVAAAKEPSWVSNVPRARRTAVLDIILARTEALAVHERLVSVRGSLGGGTYRRSSLSRFMQESARIQVQGRYHTENPGGSIYCDDRGDQTFLHR